ncbi:alpha/beta fold hydrolase [Variovorax sp. M-6]|uniref:alpha/beta fold hydrolase n=1 Tax=Variovorax sp. M-6 TaxID=3233041 RepID=UPI003F971AA8
MSAIALSLGAAALLASCGGSAPPAPYAQRNIAATHAQVAAPAWQACERTFKDWKGAGAESDASVHPTECAVLQLPLDYLDTGGQTLQMALRRRPAGNPSERIGSIIIEPGGPGGSGVESVEDFADALSARVLQRFDIVGFDPRGVGRTRATGVDERIAALPCGGGLASYIANDLSDTRPANALTLEGAAKAYAQTCADNVILPHMGTMNVVRDVEMLRRALGDAQLSYFGISYGTEVGILYAELYPAQVRAMILDGVVNPAQSGADMLVQQAVSWQQGLQHFLDWCAVQTRDEDCAIRSDPSARFQAMLNNARNDPGTLDFDGAPIALSTAWATLIPVLSIYNENPAVYAHLARVIDAASRAPADWHLLSQAASLAANAKTMGPTVWTTCLDQPLPPGDAFEAIVARAVAAAPLTGAVSANIQRPCAHLPVAPDPVPTHYAAHGTPPIMVWGTTGDPGTPWKSSAAVVAKLANASLFTFEAHQHVAKGGGPARRSCVVDVQSDYLLTATLVPQAGACAM